MKKIAVFIFVFVHLLSLAGCNASQRKYVTGQAGEKYLVLPTSKERVRIEEEYVQYLANLDANLLKQAEEKVNNKIDQYPENSGFYLYKDDEGYLCLCVEVIVKIEPPIPTGEESLEDGCGIDHEHKFFRERITK